MENGYWPIYKLGDPQVCLLNPKKRDVAGVPDSTPVSFVPMAQVDDVAGTMDVSSEKHLGEVRKGYTYFAEGDVVFAKITPCMENGKSAIARGLKNHIGFGTTEFHVLRPGPLVLPEWLHLFVRRSELRESAKSNMHGAAGQQRVPVDFLTDSDIPIPPLDEQRRIVKRIENLTHSTEDARKLRQEAVAELNQFLTSYLDNQLKSIPDNLWQPIGKFAKLQGGYAFKSEWFCEEGIRLLRNQNIYHDYIDWDKDKTVFLPVEMASQYSRFVLNKDDIVLTMDRPLIKAGLKAGRIRSADLPCLLLQRVGRFICGKGIASDYLFHCLLSQVFTTQIAGEERSNAVPHISAKQVEAIRIPIPDIRKQRDIVTAAAELRSKLDELKRLQQKTDQQIESFHSALLAKAFRGEL